ncbi:MULTISPECIES: MarR family transcriptional regulator [Clostridium]|uniref:HTH-type transcriptional regulator SarZ n=1 Tax=Clostridium sartagoforme AAU1 TaxID=1202534 RepID=R9CDK3_9CLOT|nr:MULTISPECIES: MarR family transcriptional regulator [Clostridium]EOR27333.1 MarR-family transcriptional regulator [Clostridium sartagoforme AAU1]KLE16507.1 MarR family transcriptional regulator [Clostridium sp. C8]
MERHRNVVNELLVKIFNEILQIEEKTLRSGHFSDLSVREMHTIETIGRKDQRMMSEVAQDLGITVGTLTTSINRLIKKGYVDRKRIEEDRRVVLVELTKKGKVAHRLHDRFHNEMVKTMMDGLSEDEKEVLINSLEKLNIYFKDKCENIK